MHLTDLKLRGILATAPMQIDVKTFVDPYLAMPDDVKQEDVVQSYQELLYKLQERFCKVD